MAKKEIEFRLVRKPGFTVYFNLQRKFWFGWWTVKCCTRSEAEAYVQAKRDPVVAVL